MNVGPCVSSAQQGQPHFGVAHRSPSHTHVTSKRRPKPKQFQEEFGDPTTICFKNIPNNYGREIIAELLDSSGFKDGYDFVYVPHSIKRLPKLVGLGYFFVNFVSNEVAVRAWERFTGFNEWVVPSDRTMVPTWAANTQGQKACIEKFQCSKVVNRFAAECAEFGPKVVSVGVVVPLGGCESTTWDFFEDGAPIHDSPGEIGKPDQECRADARDVISKEEASAKEELADGQVDVPTWHTYPKPRDFSWMPDASACNCTKCAQPFTLFRRRHHCRACGDICCAECAPRTSSTLSKVLIKSPTSVPTFKRVCKDCSQRCRCDTALLPGHICSQRTTQPSAPYVKNTFIDVKEEEPITFGVLDTCPF